MPIEAGAEGEHHELNETGAGDGVPKSAPAAAAAAPAAASAAASTEVKLYYPNDEGLKKFYVVVFAFSVYNMVVVPFRAAFLYDEAPRAVFLLLDYVGDAVLWAHLLIGFRIVFHDSDGMWVEDAAKIRSQYLRSPAFALNLISLLPADIFALVFGWKHYVLLRLFRFVRLPFTLRLLEMWEYGASFSNYVRLLKSLIIVILIIHSISCLYRAVAIAGHDGEALGELPDQPPQPLKMQYILSVIWTMGTLAENTGNPPRNFSEAALTAFVMFLGFSMVAAFIGGTSDLISNMNAAEVSFKEKMDIVSQFMSYRQLPPELQRRIVGYLEYMWRRQRGMDDKEILGELPPHLQAEIARHLNREILAKVPLFANADQSFLSELVTKLKPRLYGPGEFIIRYGEVGREMFFLSRGCVEVCSEDGSRVFKTMSDGEYFGEIALLLADKRTASVRAKTYCDLFCLEKSDLEELLEDYPDVHAMLREMARMRVANLAVAGGANKGPNRTVSFSAAAHTVLATTRRPSAHPTAPASMSSLPAQQPTSSDGDSSQGGASQGGHPALPRSSSWREGRRGSNASADESESSSAQTSPRGGPARQGPRRGSSFMSDHKKMDRVLRHQWALRIIRRFVQAWVAIHRALREAAGAGAAGRGALHKAQSMRDILGTRRRHSANATMAAGPAIAAVAAESTLPLSNDGPSGRRRAPSPPEVALSEARSSPTPSPDGLSPAPAGLVPLNVVPPAADGPLALRRGRASSLPALAIPVEGLLAAPKGQSGKLSPIPHSPTDPAQSSEGDGEGDKPAAAPPPTPPRGPSFERAAEKGAGAETPGRTDSPERGAGTPGAGSKAPPPTPYYMRKAVEAMLSLHEPYLPRPNRAPPEPLDVDALADAAAARVAAAAGALAGAPLSLQQRRGSAASTGLGEGMLSPGGRSRRHSTSDVEEDVHELRAADLGLASGPHTPTDASRPDSPGGSLRAGLPAPPAPPENGRTPAPAE